MLSLYKTNAGKVFVVHGATVFELDFEVIREAYIYTQTPKELPGPGRWIDNPKQIIVDGRFTYKALGTLAPVIIYIEHYSIGNTVGLQISAKGYLAFSIHIVGVRLEQLRIFIESEGAECTGECCHV